MNNNINLVSSQDEAYARKAKALRNARLVAFGSLIIVALLSIGVFILQASVPLDSVKKQEAETLTNLASLHGKVAKLYLVNDRLSNIQQIETKRQSYINTINTLVQSVPPEMTIDSFNVDKKTVVLSASGQSLNNVDDFINAMVEMGNQGKLIKGVTIENVVANAVSSKYSVTIDAQVL